MTSTAIDRRSTIVLIIVICVLGAYAISYALKTPEKDAPVIKEITFFGRDKNYSFNLTAPEYATHYTVQLSSDAYYYSQGYYDLHEVPENKTINIYRALKPHEVKIFYWHYEYANYYSLVGMEVYPESK